MSNRSPSTIRGGDHRAGAAGESGLDGKIGPCDQEGRRLGKPTTEREGLRTVRAAGGKAATFIALTKRSMKQSDLHRPRACILPKTE
jgi:hypothetical protein